MRCDAGALAHDLAADSNEVDPRGEALHASLRPALWAIEAALQAARASPSEAVAHALLARATLTEALAAFDRTHT
jgi:hypothetical protein